MKLVLILLLFLSGTAVEAQEFRKEFVLAAGGMVEVVNRYGRVDVTAEPVEAEASAKVVVSVISAEEDIKIAASNGKIKIEILPTEAKKRVDLRLSLPERTRLKITTLEGGVQVTGDLEMIDVTTDTGTIAADVPLDDVRYNFLWTTSRPRFLSDVKLEEVKEKSGGRFSIKGRIGEEVQSQKSKVQSENRSEAGATEQVQSPKSKIQSITLNFTTARGIILLNVPPNEVSSDLRERPLTNAAKAIVRSGDLILMDAIRRASPKYFGDYTRLLPPIKREPRLNEKIKSQDAISAQIKRVLVSVTDNDNRAIGNLKASDFEATENGEPAEVLVVEPSTAPFNLVLLLDVSGSVEDYVSFIRKAARNFIDTVGRDDRVSLLIFNEDVKALSGFTTDKEKLSASLDSFDAGGGTAYYDSLAYVFAHTLRPLRGERTAVVVLTDGDDNRSFLAFDSLLGALRESGALVYPLYVPSSLIAASVGNDSKTQIDPLRTRYLNVSLTTKAEAEGERLAKASGGVYYPITQLSQIQKAYEDIVVQLRTAYTVTYQTRKTSPATRLKIKVKRANAFVKLGSVVEGQNPER